MSNAPQAATFTPRTLHPQIQRPRPIATSVSTVPRGHGSTDARAGYIGGAHSNEVQHRLARQRLAARSELDFHQRVALEVDVHSRGTLRIHRETA